MGNYIKIHKNDTVAVALKDLKKGETHAGITLPEDIPRGHKFALTFIKAGEAVIKYGASIGRATRDILPGERVHTRNLASALKKNVYPSYTDSVADRLQNQNSVTIRLQNHRNSVFFGYKRPNGTAGTRNMLYIVPTVGCVNGAARTLEHYGRTVLGGRADSVVALTHPYGCSQLGEDLSHTQIILAGLIRNPNCGGALVLGLGCENNNIAVFKEALGGLGHDRVLFLNAQDVEDEIEEGKKRIDLLLDKLSRDKREPCPLSALTVGVKCGGSDGLSGITANPLIGRMTDRLEAYGAKVIMTEVPEMFGAEASLLSRAKDQDIYQKTVELIDNFKDYFTAHNVPVYENPSPGNREGGITTLEEKALGCTEKSGRAEVRSVLPYGGGAVAQGLSLLYGPGNDIVAVSALAAAGANLILFSTGRGTPLGAPVPVIKISSNTPLANAKKNWIDFDAGVTLSETENPESAEEALEHLMTETASGKQTKAEASGCYDFAIFKNGVTL